MKARRWEDVRLAAVALRREPRWSGAVVAVLAAGLGGAAGPARRAARADPAETLGLG